ncbi:MAG: GAF domain-containing protein [Nannocystaceae bacterium]
MKDSGQKNLKNKTEAFLQEFFGSGEIFVRQLILENERLRRGLNAAVPGGEVPEIAPATVVEHLMQRVAELETEIKGRGEEAGYPLLNARIEELENENYHLAAMYVACLQFHANKDPSEVLRTATEILLNFVGLGEFTVFLVDEERKVLFPVVREGGEVEEVEELPLAGSPLEKMLLRPKPWSRGKSAYTDKQAMMYLPLVSGERLLSVIRLEGFLTQKSSFESNDYSLLAMISEHAGIALDSAWARVFSNAPPLTRSAVEEHLVGA